MYARKYGHMQEETEQGSIKIPEKYDGNAFSSEAPSKEETVCREEDGEKENECFSPLRLTKFFSSDILLLLIAFLLMGSGEGDDIAGILIFLMLL